MRFRFLRNANLHALEEISAQQKEIIRKLDALMKIRIEEATLTGLVTLAEAAVAAGAHNAADLAALQATVANEEDLPPAIADRITALTPPPAPAPAP